MAKRLLPGTKQEVEALASKFSASLSAESDRGCVLVGAAFIDEGLEILLRSRMLHDAPSVKACVDPLFTGLGPLRSFWAKTQLCRALDLMSDWMYEDLERIRNLRNLFAHSYENASFEDPRVIALTEGLKAANEVVKKMKQPSETRPEADVQEQEPRQQRESPKKERVRFTISASYLAGHIHGQADAYRAARASK
jgi:DNA-binding MltR family transcriptional regulator